MFSCSVGPGGGQPADDKGPTCLLGCPKQYSQALVTCDTEELGSVCLVMSKKPGEDSTLCSFTSKQKQDVRVTGFV